SSVLCCRMPVDEAYSDLGLLGACDASACLESDCGHFGGAVGDRDRPRHRRRGRRAAAGAGAVRAPGDRTATPPVARQASAPNGRSAMLSAACRPRRRPHSRAVMVSLHRLRMEHIMSWVKWSVAVIGIMASPLALSLAVPAI